MCQALPAFRPAALPERFKQRRGRVLKVATNQRGQLRVTLLECRQELTVLKRVVRQRECGMVVEHHPRLRGKRFVRATQRPASRKVHELLVEMDVELNQSVRRRL